MKQNLVIAAPKKSEVLESWGTLREVLFDGMTRWLVVHFAVPLPPPFHDSSLQPQITKERPMFLNLPNELQDLIFQHLKIEDILNLSLANRYSWRIGLRRLRTYFLSFMGPWAGESIICVDKHMEVGDYPLGGLTEDEGHELYRYLNDSSLIYNEVRARIQLPTNLLQPFVDSIERLQMPDFYVSQTLRAVYPKLSEFYPCNQLWILRNLTMQEFVRADAIALKPEYIHGPEIDVIGFGEVIISRVYWSSLPASLAYDKDIHRGVWAGHRFDITTLARHRKETREDMWTDVSEEVVEEIAEIWENQYGSNWRQIVCNKKLMPYSFGRELKPCQSGIVHRGYQDPGFMRHLIQKKLRQNQNS